MRAADRFVCHASCLRNKRASQSRPLSQALGAMAKLKQGDRIRLSGGYSFEPEWLKGAEGYDAVVTGFFDNGIEGRKGDERLSASIEFDDDAGG